MLEGVEFATGNLTKSRTKTRNSPVFSRHVVMLASREQNKKTRTERKIEVKVPLTVKRCHPSLVRV